MLAPSASLRSAPPPEDEDTESRDTESARYRLASGREAQNETPGRANPRPNRSRVKRSMVEVRGFEPLAPTLRMQRPHPSDRGKRALTGGNARNVSRRFSWFLSVSRTRRARSPIPPHPQRRPIRCPADPHASLLGSSTPPERRNETNRAGANSSTGRSPPDRGVQHHPHHRITHTQPVVGGEDTSSESVHGCNLVVAVAGLIVARCQVTPIDIKDAESCRLTL